MKKAPKSPPKKSAFKKIKNFLTLLILLAFSGFVFYMGWIQIRIPEGEYALIYTKFPGGYDDRLISSGEFIWRWENLFPTNMTIHYIELDPQHEQISLEYELPSGKLYADYIDQQDAFHAKIDARYSFQFKEASVQELVRNGSYSKDLLENRYNAYSSEIQEIVLHALSGIDGIKDPAETEKELMIQINEQIQDIELLDFKLYSLRLPDLALYRNVRLLYLEQIKELNKNTVERERALNTMEIHTKRKMDLLRQYGELLSEYPVLLEYFDLEAEKLDPELFSMISE